MWGHMIQMEKHGSYDQPPDLPYFRKGEKSVTHSQVHPMSSPPAKGYRCVQCIEQLDKWHALLDKGGITQEQYDELQTKIFKDMKDM